MKRTWTIIGVADVSQSFKWYQSLLGLPLRIPAGWPLDARLLSGSAVFGIGWGLVGICPGPAVVALGAGQPKAAAFVVAMLAGMAGYEFVMSRATVAPHSAEHGARS